MSNGNAKFPTSNIYNALLHKSHTSQPNLTYPRLYSLLLHFSPSHLGFILGILQLCHISNINQ